MRTFPQNFGRAPNATFGQGSRCHSMEHKGIRYQVVQTCSPTGFLWTVYLDEKSTKTGVSFSKENAVFNAERAIDRALGRKLKNLPKT
jgi:hypothetical protein